MRYLLDTHAALWYFEQNDKLTQETKAIILDPENVVYISSASLWEVAIKIGLGKIDVSFDKLLGELERAAFIVMQTEKAYLRRLLDLPQIHKDPFDRLIIATALAEDMTLVTADDNIHKYDVRWVW